jgi:serine/threonine-protein kinase
VASKQLPSPSASGLGARRPTQAPPAYAFGPFRLDSGERLLRREGHAVRLTPKAIQVLLVLVENAGRPLDKDELLRAVWPDSVVEENTLARNISTLRRALGEKPGRPAYVVTIPGRGYRFAAPVSRALDSLAVLPFADTGTDAETESLGDGITESLIASLSRVPQLRVVPRTTVFRYKDRRADPLALGRELDVRALVTGQVTMQGESLVVKAELLEVASERQLWGDRYRRKLSDIFAVQEEIAREIAGTLHVRLGIDPPAPLTRRHTESSEAYQSYLLGRFHLGKRTREAMTRASLYFAAAVERDPRYARAHAGLADACALLASGTDGPRALELVDRARSAARRAIELEPTLAEAHTSLAFVLHHHDWAWSDAEREFERALELDPEAATARHWYAMFLATMGRTGEALEQVRSAQALDPLSLVINAALGRVLHFARRFEDAVQQYSRTLELDPSFAEAHFDLGMSYEEMGLYAEARRELEAAVTLSGANPTQLTELARCHALSGNASEACRLLQGLEQAPAQPATLAFDSAYVHLALGDRDRALERLEQACARRCGGLVYIQVDPALDGLRSEARFQELVRRVGLAP